MPGVANGAGGSEVAKRRGLMGRGVGVLGTRAGGGAGSHVALACAVGLAEEAPVLRVFEGLRSGLHGPAYCRTYRLETVEPDTALPPVNLVPVPGGWRSPRDHASMNGTQNNIFKFYYGKALHTLRYWYENTVSARPHHDEIAS